MQTADLRIAQGSTWSVTFPVLDESGDPMSSLAGWTARAQIRESVSSATVLFEWHSDGTKPGAVDLSDGQVTLSVTSAQSSAWTWARGVYDLELVSPSGEVWRPVGGRVRVSPEVTR